MSKCPRCQCDKIAQAVREKDADFVQQARELAEFFFSKGEPHDPRVSMTYWLGKGHGAVYQTYRRNKLHKGGAK